MDEDLELFSPEELIAQMKRLRTAIQAHKDSSSQRPRTDEEY